MTTPFSGRADWRAAPNKLAVARAERTRRGDEVLDLTESNPTRAGIEYPLDELSAIFARAARAPYAPQSLGLTTAREALANEFKCDAGDIVLTASTSEAYSFLFKLLADPGDSVATPAPTYPLLEHLAALELIELRYFSLELHRRWEVSVESLRDALTPRTRAVVVVHPNNPTGSFLTMDEQDSVAASGLPIISDEVFYDYPLDAPRRAPTAAARTDVLTFALGGLSKSGGMPHYKLGWIRVGGPPALRQQALSGLELIADSFLSVSTPAQQALPDLLRMAPAIRAAIQERVRSNLALLTAQLAGLPAAALLPIEGGWSAVIRFPRTHSDEEIAHALLDRGVAVHPGYFFDFAIEGAIVISLLTRPDVFSEGVSRILALGG